MSSLYTQEEIDKYFEGRDDVMIRAKMYEIWRLEWHDRSVYVKPGDYPTVFKDFIHRNNLLRTDWVRTSTVKGACISFRNEEDYLSALLTFS